MKKSSNTRSFAYFLWLILAACSLQIAWAGPIGVYQHGTVVRMRMGDCAFTHRGFMANFAAGAGPQAPVALCPEYTLVSDKVVFVIVGRSSEQLVPLADSIDFRFHNNELAVRIDDASHESKFNIKEMILRSEWELLQKHLNSELNAPIRTADSSMAVRGED